jgi:hypothetical protein
MNAKSPGIRRFLEDPNGRAAIYQEYDGYFF